MRVIIILLVLVTISSSASASVVPEIANPGFEEGASGWGWMTYNGARTGYRVVTDNPHSGSRCMSFWNESGVAPHVYGRFTTGVNVLPETSYELSVWVRGEDVGGKDGVPHFTDWQIYTLNLPAGTYDWQRVSTVFKTSPGQYVLTLGLNVGCLCKTLAIDDISLKPVGLPLKGSGVDGSVLAPMKLIGHNAPGYIGIFADLQQPAVVEAVVSAGNTRIFRKKANLKAGDNRIEWEWNSGKIPFGDMDCAVRVLDKKGVVLAEAFQKVEKVDSPVSAEIDKAQERLKEFNQLYEECRRRGLALDYPTTAKTLLEQFIPLAREDVQKGHTWRAEFAAKDFQRTLDDSIAEMKAYLANPQLVPNAKRFRTGKVDIDGLSFIGTKTDSKGRTERGPVFFCGYGHFGQVRKDMPKWPGYGINIIQIEVGPSVVMPAEDEIDLKPIRDVAKVLDDAAKHNVRVDVLLSPHYFPQWAVDKWPHLAKGGGHFIGYCVDAPEAKQVMEKFLRTAVPLLKDKPALHSFCLSNEPVFNNTANCDNTVPLWAAYLARIHGDIGTLNKRYGTDYTKFEDVPIPGNESYDAPQFYDYCVFNQERFAGWHKWMADLVHDMVPNVPVHAKMMSMALPHRFTISWGCDPELFGELSDINGNDCLIRGRPGGGWGLPWHLQNMSYDLQRSLARKPVFNSENHPTEDRSTYYVAPEHFKTVLWQGAVHGQGATTIWVWEYAYDKGSDLYGNVMDRPGCAQAVGTTCLDLNRFADEVTALQNAKAPVAIIFSIASITRSPKYQEVLYHAYCGLNFCGVKIDFISEKQLAAGKGKEYKMIILPQASHVLPSTFEAIKNLPDNTRIVFIGDSLVKDPYGQEYPADQLKALRDRALCLDDADPEKVLWPKFLEELGRIGGLPEESVVGLSSGKPVWGVEWLPTQIGNKRIVNIVNLLDKPVRVKILRRGREVQAKDLLSLGGREQVRLLKPMTPVLADISQEEIK